MKNRKEMIERLASNLIDNTRQDFILFDIFVEGFKGYENFTDEELKQEYQETFDR